MASKSSFYNSSGVTNTQSNAIDASVSNAASSETAAANSATAAASSTTSASNSATAAANSASSASTSATTSTTSKDASVVAKDAAVVAKDAAVVAKNAAESAASASLAKSNNLSDLANASTARTNLGVAIGSNVQAYSSTLQSTTAAYTSALNTKLSGIEASADVTDTANVVAALTAGTNITIAANGTIASTGGGGGSSYTHPNHSGEVTSSGDGATAIASNVVDADNLKVTGNGSNTQFLRSDGDGTFTWATPADTNTTYSIGDGGLTTNDFTNADHTKLNGIATGATAYTNANAVSAVTASDLDMGGNKVLFSNMYATLGALPSATDNHGMFAHVHATGKGYFAHGGNWIALANASDITTYTHPNHTGEVTSTADGATVIADNIVDEANLKISNTPTNGYVLTAQSGNTGGLTWAAAASGGGADLYAAETTNSTDPSVTGTLAIAIGSGADGNGNSSVAIGDGADSHGNSSVAIGDGAKAGTYSVAIGYGTSDSGPNNTLIGRISSSSYRTSQTIIGYNADGGDYKTGSLAIGYNAKSMGHYSVALGQSYAVGNSSFAVAITSNSSSYGASGANSIAIGQLSKATQANSIAIGDTAISTTANQIALGGATDTVKISNTYTLPTSDGSNGQVLTTNGSGVISFATAGGGGGITTGKAIAMAMVFG